MDHADFALRLEHYAVASSPFSPATSLNHDLIAGLATGSWWDNLRPEQKDECLAEMLNTQDPDTPRDQWLPLVAASARSGAPNAREICRRWSKRSPRYDSTKFDTEFSSFEGDC